SRWDEMASLLTEDVECAYSDGKYTFNNRDELMQFLRSSHDATESMTVSYWHVTMPEISLTTETTASGKWGMYHFFLNKAENQQLEMFSYYDDEYVKIAGEWKIRKTGYHRVMEQEMDRNNLEGLKLNVG
ncbi:MAG: nuclear transport factor 2 family protein, partial [Pseudomonadales bacterium]